MGQLITAFEAAVAPLVGPLAAAHGEPSAPVAAAWSAAGRTWLGALALHAARGDSSALVKRAAALFDNGNPIDGAAETLTDTAARQRLAAAGELLAADLIGPQLAPIASRIASLTAARGETVASILALAGPLALGTAARALGADRSPGAIAALIDSERESLVASLPPGIRPLLAPVGVAAAEARPAAPGSWIPWAAAAALALLALLGVRGWLDRPMPAPAPTPAGQPMVTAAPGMAKELVLPDGAVLVLMPGTAAFELARFLDGTDAGPRRIAFEPLAFGPGERRLGPEAERSVRAVAAVLSAFPLARVTIIGESSAGPDAAQALARSARQAKLVELELAAAGIAPERLSSEGQGHGGAPPGQAQATPGDRLALIAARG